MLWTHVLFSLLSIFWTSLLAVPAFAPYLVNKIRLTLASSLGFRRKTFLCFQRAVADVVKHRAAQHWYAMEQSILDLFCYNFRTSSVAVQTYLLTHLTDTLWFFYYPGNSSGWGDVFQQPHTQHKWALVHLSWHVLMHLCKQILGWYQSLVKTARKRGWEKENSPWRWPGMWTAWVNRQGDQKGEGLKQLLLKHRSGAWVLNSPRHLRSSLTHPSRRALSKFCLISYMPAAWNHVSKSLARKASPVTKLRIKTL